VNDPMVEALDPRRRKYGSIALFELPDGFATLIWHDFESLEHCGDVGDVCSLFMEVQRAGAIVTDS
jgi:hypothetical protein